VQVVRRADDHRIDGVALEEVLVGREGRRLGTPAERLAPALDVLGVAAAQRRDLGALDPQEVRDVHVAGPPAQSDDADPHGAHAGSSNRCATGTPL